MGMGEKSFSKAKNYIEYFILRGLDLLNSEGLLIYIIGAETGGGGKPFLDQPMTKTKEMIIARVCKKAAVKAGQVLSPEEQKQLLLDLESCQSPRTCPHGRPTMIHLPVGLLEKKFGRTGAI